MIKCGDILNVKNKNTCFYHEYRVNQNDFIKIIKIIKIIKKSKILVPGG